MDRRCQYSMIVDLDCYNVESTVCAAMQVKYLTHLRII